jgi:exodeoxyribonuclease VII large subunit
MKKNFIVSQLHNNIKAFFDEKFVFIWVEGEVSNLKRLQFGHIFFRLKDDKNQIKAVFFCQFGGYKQQTNFELKECLTLSWIVQRLCYDH